ncbi:MAG: signal peptidase II [Armatimonadetes bacterium]|nr:signal peptidase II [Armatimonadota bacterium]
MTPAGKSALFYATAASAVVVDQVTKAIARGTLEPDMPVTVIPGFFDLRLSFNTGAAFGILPNWAPLFMVVALVAIFAIVRLRRQGPDSRALTVGLGLLLGGALGNLIDRLLLPGRAVTDFLSFHINIGGQLRAWPTFNIADIAVVLGAALLFLHVYILEKRRA